MRLVINTGSTSKKYALYSDVVQVFSARLEEKADGFEMTVSTEKEEASQSVISEKTFQTSLEKVLDIAQTEGVITGVDNIEDVGMRIVAPGTYFTEHRRIDADFLHRFEEMQSYAPLHITPTLSEITKVQRLLPHVDLFGVSDSAFHTSIPEKARRYSIKNADTERYDIWRFGYHGLSVSSVVRKLERMGDAKSRHRIVVCHFGGGVSVTAIEGGESLDTSMGFSPVGGLHMSTRTGDIDSGAVIYLAQQKGFSYEDMREYLNKEGGFRGVTDGVSDVRALLDLYQKNDEKAVLAIEMFTYRMKKYIGGYIASLGGIDTLVLTATVNERSAIARSLICRGLEHLGIEFDEEKNNTLTFGKDAFIHQKGSSAHIAVIHTDEMGEIARIVTEINK